MDNYLMHHGVKGQRKGIRRYQNNDATRTLTPEGRIHYGVGPPRESKSGDLLVKKGAVVNRIASSGEPLDEHRKYASFTNKDNRMYYEYADAIGIPAGDPIERSAYEVTQDLLLPNPDETGEYVIDNFGTEAMKKLKKYGLATGFNAKLYSSEKYNDAIKFLEKENEKFKATPIGKFLSIFGINKYSKKAIEKYAQKAALKATDEYVTVRYKFNELYDELMKNDSSEVFSHYKELGYNAVFDMFDYGGFTDLPIVIPNPASVLKKTKSVAQEGHSTTKINESYMDETWIGMFDSNVDRVEVINKIDPELKRRVDEWKGRVLNNAG